jgi:hypothetical protein
MICNHFLHGRAKVVIVNERFNEKLKTDPLTAQKPVDRQLPNLAWDFSAQIWFNSTWLVAVGPKVSQPWGIHGFYDFRIFSFLFSSTKAQPKLQKRFSWLIAQSTGFRPRYTFSWVSLHLLSYCGRGPQQPPFRHIFRPIEKKQPTVRCRLKLTSRPN